MTWSFARGVWMSDPFTICVQLDERTKVVLFELYDHTRFVKVFASEQEAKKHAQVMAYVGMEKAS